MTLPRRPRDPDAMVDIMFRNKVVRRNTPARWWRFGPSDAVPEWDFDIVRCQPSGATKKTDDKTTWTAKSGGYS